MNSDEPVFFSEAGKRKGVKDVPHKSLESAISSPPIVCAGYLERNMPDS